MTGQATLPATGAASFRRLLRRVGELFGPGFVFLVAAMGPQDLVSNSAAGANYGYSLLWSLALLAVARYVILEASGRYVVVTGETILAGYGRCGRLVPWVICGGVVVKRHLSNLYEILLLGATAHMLVPLPVAASEKIWALAVWTLGFALMLGGRYRAVERFLRPLGFLLGGALVGVVILSRPDPLAAVRGLFLPSVPDGTGFYQYTLVLMALAGTSAGSVTNLKFAAFVHEEGWHSAGWLRRQRREAVISAAGLFVMAVLTQVAAAAVLHPLGVAVKDVGELAALFAIPLGHAGRVLFAVGLWAAVLTTVLGANTGDALLVSDGWHNVLYPRPQDETLAGRMPAYRWSLVAFCLLPLYVLWTGWKPVWIVMITAALRMVLLPLVAVVLLWLTASRKRMGAHANGWATNVILGLIGATTLYLILHQAALLLFG